MYMDNFSDTDGDPSGKLDGFFSPKIDLSTNQDAYLTFNVAYAKFSAGYADTLAVYVSVDCGANFHPIWFKGGNDLATATNTENSFVPSSSEWIKERISLKDYNGFSDLHIAFVNWSGWGNNLYIDDINILVPTYSSPTISGFFSPKEFVPVGTTVSFSDYSANYPTSWSWSFPGGNPASSNLQNPYVTYNTAGTFNVELTTSNTSGGNTENKTSYITVVGKPVVNITSDKTNNTICKGDTIILTASGGTYYKWYDERGYLISEENTLELFPQKTETYKLTGYDNYGGYSSSSISVTIKSATVISLNSDKINNTICKGDEIILTATGGTNYKWYDKNNSLISQENSISVFPQETSSYNVIESNSSECPSSATITTIVNPLPDFSIGQDKTISLTGSLQLAVDKDYKSYLWSNSSTQKTLTIKGEEYGVGEHKIYVRVTDDNGCSASDTTIVTVTNTSNILIPYENSSLRIYPVPTNDFLTVKSDNLSTLINGEIYSIEGKLVKSFLIKNKVQTLDLQDLPNGVYNIRLFTNDFDKTVKILKTSGQD